MMKYFELRIQGYLCSSGHGEHFHPIFIDQNLLDMVIFDRELEIELMKK